MRKIWGDGMVIKFKQGKTFFYDIFFPKKRKDILGL